MREIQRTSTLPHFRHLGDLVLKFRKVRVCDQVLKFSKVRVWDQVLKFSKTLSQDQASNQSWPFAHKLNAKDRHLVPT